MEFHRINTARQKWLLLGWTIGPFVLNFMGLGVQASLGWPKISWLQFATLFVPILFGAVCAIRLYRPRRWDFLLAVPYFLTYTVAQFATTIVFAIMLGAPK